MKNDKEIPLGPVYHFDLCTQFHEGVEGHPQKVMKELASSQGALVRAACPHSIGDCWFFELDKELKEPPKYLTLKTIETEENLRFMFPNLYGEPKDRYIK